MKTKKWDFCGVLLMQVLLAVGGFHEYIRCAVWHGQDQSNRADELFAAVAESMHGQNPQARSVFVTHGNLYQVIYCTESGKKAGRGCTSIEQGYFADKSAPEPCDLHQ